MLFSRCWIVSISRYPYTKDKKKRPGKLLFRPPKGFLSRKENNVLRPTPYSAGRHITCSDWQHSPGPQVFKPFPANNSYLIGKLLGKFPLGRLWLSGPFPKSDWHKLSWWHLAFGSYSTMEWELQCWESAQKSTLYMFQGWPISSFPAQAAPTDPS